MTIKLKTRVWDAAENVDTGEDITVRLEAALQDGGAALNGVVLGTTADVRLSLQMQYDLWVVMKKPMPRVQPLAA